MSVIQIKRWRAICDQCGTRTEWDASGTERLPDDWKSVRKTCYGSGYAKDGFDCWKDLCPTCQEKFDANDAERRGDDDG